MAGREDESRQIMLTAPGLFLSGWMISAALNASPKLTNRLRSSGLKLQKKSQIRAAGPEVNVALGLIFYS
jgi:hypothetical protein